MDTLLCNQDGTILFGDATSGADNLLSSQETLAFLYTGSATQATYTWNAGGVTYADILVVGGGGGSQNSADNTNPRGGGGGGEVVFRQGVAVTPNTIVKVGRGGPVNTNGGISEFGAIRANGGGTSGAAGGSGGGANRTGTAGQAGGVSSKLSADGMGNNGGANTSFGAGGGGGATQPGSSSGGDGGQAGGQGYTPTIFGVWNTVYGSGGGSGQRNPSSGTNRGGLGGTNAGNGGASDGNPAAEPGVANTGGGAGGAGAYGVARPGAVGGSGIVLVKPNPGILDGLGSSVYSTAVGAYAMRRLFGAYTGPQARLRRSTDSAEIDVYFDKYGRPVNFNLDGWLAGATGYIVTWYDQSLGAKHLTQTTAASQPFIVTTGDKNHIRFQNKLLTGPNVFGTSIVSDMHMVAALRENTRSANYFISLNGSNNNSTGRFFIHAPFNTGVWYWDAGSTDTARASGATSTVGAKSIFSGYKSSSDGKNGFRINGGTRYLSSGLLAATVTDGVQLGGGATDHSIYELLIFTSKLSASIETFLEQAL